MDDEIERRRDSDHWSLDKRVPIAIILAMIAQITVAIWWLSELNSRVYMLEKSFDSVTNNYTGSVGEIASIRERVIKMEVNIINIGSNINEIKDIVKERKK